MRELHAAHRPRRPHFLRFAARSVDKKSADSTPKTEGAANMYPECSCCGAVMSAVKEGDDAPNSFMCKHCGNAFFPEATQSEPASTISDGVVDTGEHLSARCPVCKDATLSGGTIENQKLLYCKQCRGVLISNRNFSEVLTKLRKTGAKSQPDKDPQPIDPTEFERKITCPNCSIRMDVHPYYGPGNVIIDSCCRCFLIWFDHGEIAAIQDAQAD